MEIKDKEERALKQARAQMNAISTYVSRLRHARICDGGSECALTDREIYDGLNMVWIGIKATSDERAQYHSEEEILKTITGQVISLTVRSSWEKVDAELNPAEYNILLCTGGPAVRIIGDLDATGKPESAHMEYQDYDIPWMDMADDENGNEAMDADLLEFALQLF